MDAVELLLQTLFDLLLFLIQIQEVVLLNDSELLFLFVLQLLVLLNDLLFYVVDFSVSLLFDELVHLVLQIQYGFVLSYSLVLIVQLIPQRNLLVHMHRLQILICVLKNLIAFLQLLIPTAVQLTQLLLVLFLQLTELLLVSETDFL